MSRVLIYGGAFDPPHYGHLRTASSALEYMRHRGFSHLWFLPSKADVFGVKNFAPAEHRKEMIRRLIVKNEDMSLHSFELQQPDTIGTLTLMRRLRKEFTKMQFVFVIGSDQAMSIVNWRKSRQLRREVKFLVVPRAGYFARGNFEWAFHAPHEVVLGFTTPPRVSSTSVRHCFKIGTPGYLQSAKEQMPISIFRYIQQHNLYR